MKSVLLLSVCFLFSINVSSGIVCETENMFGSTSYVTCPRSYDDPNEIFCCGSKYSVDCCSNPLGLEQEDFEKLADKLPAILGTLFAIAIGLVVLCVVCCCCCPFCLLHKKRSRGAVHQPALGTTYVTYAHPTAVTQMQPPSNYAPVQQPHQYPNTSYPPQQPGYAPPHQPQGYGMPPQAAGAPYPTSQPQYPASQPPYPTSPSAGNEQPPPYTEKQLPFNPNY